MVERTIPAVRYGTKQEKLASMLDSKVLSPSSRPSVTFLCWGAYVVFHRSINCSVGGMETRSALIARQLRTTSGWSVRFVVGDFQQGDPIEHEGSDSTVTKVCNGMSLNILDSVSSNADGFLSSTSDAMIWHYSGCFPSPFYTLSSRLFLPHLLASATNRYRLLLRQQSDLGRSHRGLRTDRNQDCPLPCFRR